MTSRAAAFATVHVCASGRILPSLLPHAFSDATVAVLHGGMAASTASVSGVVQSSARRLTMSAGAAPNFGYAAPQATPEPTSSWRRYMLGALAGAAGGGAGALGWKQWQRRQQDEAGLPSADEGAHLVNWSGTHEVSPRRLYEPESLEQLEKLVAHHHRTGQKLRPVGSALSPNGLGFADGDKTDMVSLALLDEVVEVDRVSGQARVQAGARIADVVEALRPHGLALQNIASIREQAMGGFVQVGAHGTGAGIPPMDEQVVALTLVTPRRGTLRLSQDDPDPELFYLTRVGLGACGVVAEVTLQTVAAHRLRERTWVSTMKDVRRSHAKTLQDNRHVRYMWIPHTEAVVVVASNPEPDGAKPLSEKQRNPGGYSDAEKTAAFKQLFLERNPDADRAALVEMGFAQLRDELLAGSRALEPAWVRRVNEAEADFWRRNSGYRVGNSDDILAFDCGGQQWVLETAFPAGTRTKPSGADLAYMEELLAQIERQGVAAPAPIEQRWCARSRSALSPATSGDPEGLTSWVGIIMYLPGEGTEERTAITNTFREYAAMVEAGVAARHGAVPHWAKAEIPEHPGDLRALQSRLAARYPVARFAAARKQLDPKGILSNNLVDTLLPRDV